jgi:hypothetical protein
MKRGDGNSGPTSNATGESEAQHTSAYPTDEEGRREGAAAAQLSEPRHHRLTRNFNELLQELRVAQAGVQILFAFLLSVAFTDRFAWAGSYVHALHLSTVVLATASAALLIAPAAWHRVLFRQRRREEILRVANWCAISGLALLAAAMTGTVLLIALIVLGAGWGSAALGVCVGLLFAVLWFLLPLRTRIRSAAR